MLKIDLLLDLLELQSGLAQLDRFSLKLDGKLLLLYVDICQLSFHFAEHLLSILQLLCEGFLLLAHLILLLLHLAELHSLIDIGSLVSLLFFFDICIHFSLLLIYFIQLHLHIIELFFDAMGLLSIMIDCRCISLERGLEEELSVTNSAGSAHSTITLDL